MTVICNLPSWLQQGKSIGETGFANNCVIHFGDHVIHLTTVVICLTLIKMAGKSGSVM